MSGKYLRLKFKHDGKIGDYKIKSRINNGNLVQESDHFDHFVSTSKNSLFPPKHATLRLSISISNVRKNYNKNDNNKSHCRFYLGRGGFEPP